MLQIYSVFLLLPELAYPPRRQHRSDEFYWSAEFMSLFRQLFASIVNLLIVSAKVSIFSNSYSLKSNILLGGVLFRFPLPDTNSNEELSRRRPIFHMRCDGKAEVVMVGYEGATIALQAVEPIVPKYPTSRSPQEHFVQNSRRRVRSCQKVLVRFKLHPRALYTMTRR